MSKLNDLIDDETIKTAIESKDDPDHPDALTVADVRDALDQLEESVVECWPEECANIKHGDHQPLKQTDGVLVVDGGEWNMVQETLKHHPEMENDQLLSRVLTQIVHEVADRHVDHSWSVHYPWLVPLPDDGEAGQEAVEAIINNLLNHGCSPGQAWAYYGVVVRGESRNKWSKRCGYGDHSATSEAVRKAKKTLPW